MALSAQPADPGATLVVEGVAKRYGDVTALAGVDLTIDPGEIVALLGPNGAGKTTLVETIAGLRPPDAGRIAIGGVDLHAEPLAAKRMMALASQEIAVYPTLSVGENLRYFGELGGLRGEALRRRIDQIAPGLDLSGKLESLTATLSGGERRRLHAAVALLHRPRLLLLDEPTAGADVEMRGELLRMLRETAGEGAAILYTTHYLSEVEQLHANVALIESGRIIVRGRLDELLAEYSTPSVELIFEGPLPPLSDCGGTVEGNVLRIETQDPPATIARALSGLGAEAPRLRSIEVIQASLEAVYLALTGRRYAGEREEMER